MTTNYYSTDQREGKNLLCTKCNVVSHMKKIPYGKKLNEFSLWCCNCEDKISQGSVMEIKDMTSSNLKETSEVKNENTINK